MSGLKTEGMAFLVAVLTGMIIVCGYMCVRKFRRLFVHSVLATAIEDLLYWIVSAVYVFVQMFHTSSGNIRWYFVVGVILGVYLFFRVCRILPRIWRKIAKKRE